MNNERVTTKPLPAWILALAGALWLALLSATVYAEKPTRKEIVAFSDDCTKQRVKMDVVGRFGTDFSGLDLSGVSFRGRYRATGTNLRGADFTDANLTGADFGDSILDGTEFTGADLTNASFRHASMRNVTLKNVNVTGTSFYASNLTEAKMAGIDLSQGKIGGAQFGDANLSGSTLAGADTIGYAPLSFQNANLTDADLHGLNLDEASFQDTTLRRANLSGSQLEAADFTRANLQGAILENALLWGAVFEDVQGLSDAETRRLSRRAARWRFLLKTGMVAFLDSYAFPVLLLLVTPLVVILARRRRKLASPEGATRYQFSLSSMLLLTALIGSFIGVAILSLTGAYSYAMVGAFCMMLVEIVRGRAGRKFSVRLLATALVYVPLNLVMWSALSISDGAFMIGVVFVGPAVAISGVIVAAIIAWRAKKRVPALSLLAFIIWIAGIGVANIWLLSKALSSP